MDIIGALEGNWKASRSKFRRNAIINALLLRLIMQNFRRSGWIEFNMT